MRVNLRRIVLHDFYEPRVLFELGIRWGRDVGHAIPGDDGVTWLASGPLVTIPILLITLAYANGYYTTYLMLAIVDTVITPFQFGFETIRKELGRWLKRRRRPQSVQDD